MSIHRAAHQPPDPTAHMASKRRRFQPPITSFFPSSATTQHVETSNGISLSPYDYSTVTSSPVSEPIGQATLITVGMRVRKKMADSLYKTDMEKMHCARMVDIGGGGGMCANSTTIGSSISFFFFFFF